MLIAALRKELLLQWRSRAQFMAVFVFGAAALLLFSFAVGPVAEMLRQFSAGFLWLGLLLSSTLTLAESFHAEMENRAMEGLLLLPANPRALYYGKAIANWLQLILLGIALVPVMVILYDAGTTRQVAIIVIARDSGLGARDPLRSDDGAGAVKTRRYYLCYSFH
jgi:heme exporter protein B